MITVLMAAKTSTEYMPQAVGSLLGQSYQDWQLIIGVNGLPDDHPAHRRANELVDVIDRACVVTHMGDCRGKGEALNRMMEYARGDYVAILDVDDLWHPLKLERQIDTLERYVGCEVCGTRGLYFGDTTGDIGTPAGRIKLTHLLQRNCLLNSSVVMARKHAHWEPMDEPLEDYQLWLRLASEDRYLYNLDDHLTFIRQHAGNWSKQSNHEAALARLRARYE
jgi:glycosyltransferase involved in cell wall biosynthesis